MVFSRKKRDNSVEELSDIIHATEGDENVASTVVEAASTINQFRNKYFNNNFFNPVNIYRYFKRGGMIIYTNYLDDTQLKVNGGDAVFINDDSHTIYNQKGKKKLERILNKNVDGAVEMSPEGILKSYFRMLGVDADDVAVEIGLVDSREQASSAVWGFKGKPVFARHKDSIASTAKDARIYLITLSEETGDWRVMKAGRILYSTNPGETHASYLPHITPKSFKNPAHSSPSTCNPTYKRLSTPRPLAH